jgi:DNA-binding transcriptional ArsR family regulator
MTHDERAGAVFHALADPTRRTVVRALAEGGTVTASGLAAQMPVSRQAITKHLAALRDAGLAEARTEGREVHYHLTPAPLSDAMDWMAAAGANWDARLDRLRKRVER